MDGGADTMEGGGNPGRGVNGWTAQARGVDRWTAQTRGVE